MQTILVRRDVLVAVLACTMLLLMPTMVTAEDAVAPQANVVNVCQATTGNCATECLDSTTEVVRTSDATVHCIHAYTTATVAASAPPATVGAAVAAAAAAVGGIRGSANSNQTMDDTNEAAQGVVDTVAAALAYDGRGIDYYDPVTNLPVTMVWENIVPCTANEVGQCHHPNYPLDDEEEEEEAEEEADEDEAEAEEDGADIEAEAEEEEEDTEDDDEELMTTTTTPPTYGPTAVTTTPTFAPTAMATTPTVAPTATYRPTSFPTTLYSRTDAQDVCLSSSLENDCSECTDTQSVVTTGSPAVEYPTYCVKYAGSTRQDTDGGIFYIVDQDGGTNLKRFADIPSCAPNDENACHTPPDYANRACTTTVDDCPQLNNSVEYCAESLGLCVPVGTCGAVDDCLNSDNDGQYAVVACDGGMMECQNGYCSMNCNPNESNTNATATNEREEEEENNDTANDEEIGPEMGTNTTTLTNTTQSMETTTVATETNTTTDTSTNTTTTTDPSDNDASREEGSLMTVSYSTNEEDEDDKPLNKTEELDLFFDSMNEYYTTNTDTTNITSNTDSTLAINQLETSEQYSASSAAVTLTTTTTLPTCFVTTLGVVVVALCSVW